MKTEEATQNASKILHFYDFKVENEPWNIYLLEDHAKLKVKIILVTFALDYPLEDIARQKKETGKPVRVGVANNFNVVSGVEVPPSILGVPGETPPKEELRKHVVKEDIEVLQTNEIWNEYRIEKGINLKAKYVLTNVDRTDVRDPNGSPIYLVNGDIAVKLRFPKSLEGSAELPKKSSNRTKDSPT